MAISDMTEDQKTALKQGYIAGIPVPELCKQFGLPPGVVYNYAAREGLTRKGVKPQSIAVDASPTVQQIAPQPVQVVKESEPTITSAGACPLFPQRAANQIDHLEIRRIITNPPEEWAKLGRGLLLEHADLSFDEAAIREAFGGGRYEVKAINAHGKELGRKPVVIPGRSRPLEVDEYGTTGQATNGNGNSGEPVLVYPKQQDMAHVMELIRQQGDNTRAMMEQMQRNSNEARENERRVAEERNKEKEGFYAMQAQLMRDSHQQNLQMMQTMFAQKADAPSPLTQLADIAKIIEVVKGISPEAPDSDPVSKAIDKLPEILTAADKLIHGSDEWDDEEEDDESEDAAPTPAQPKGPPDYKLIARALFEKLVADGVPEKDARQMVSQGFSLIDHKVKSAAAKQAAPPRKIVEQKPTASPPSVESQPQEKPQAEVKEASPS